MIQPVIIAGGVGSRLWPLSREQYPKQFLTLLNDKSLLQNTLLRLKDLHHLPPIIVCNHEHRFLVAEQLRMESINVGGIILEPKGKNTAPAVALSAFFVNRCEINLEKDPVLLVLAADHVIDDTDGFLAAINSALPLAQNGMLVTFGVVPTHPETGYGYIQTGKKIIDNSFEIIDFKEKPSLEKAQEYLDSKNYLWNSGMFMFRASTYLNELKKFRSDIYDACFDAMNSSSFDFDFVHVNKENFSLCLSESIDYAVMEQTDKGVVVPIDIGWSDIGSWSALWDVCSKDTNNNVIKGDVIEHDSHNCFIIAETSLVTTIGLNNLIIIQSNDSLLIADRHSSQMVKNIVDELKEKERHEYYFHSEGYRPWGKYKTIDTGENYQVKRITVRPGGKLSMQIHYHRAEHWVIVSGTARVIVDGNTKLLRENESIYIPQGCIHSLENPGETPLDIIEVRSGVYLEDDDVVRFQ
ncbi:mannose-1-phosphate guanylyltransferase/mannose-6-phosphate isomerase [Escherichia coli]|uniref:mannose-1-phosphate guanylyltransferase/mannose-6-phosphate isomerase n=1 Tax=Escherichia coli TaxID=562 RepID=UPI0002A1CC85|nr:mannose-1-phosphate guanylyltransferase/mannose-6-phosphate isomerase [Escherichia coli]EEY3970393.1 mannose-1-phosphate guanylyltransferase/mannose-6-phosphate isomerase [Escherichia coli]EFG1107953.1 mannose-1-phosphate guanylyltransferase/mannose-6-phosphate isomerase [Escherichia coli]EFI5649837.1 mannose-1-phosphate guanylyltransferase/mannose-6-phosphate isomerase [Escherichia coli]EFN7238956.1 mannose-1-phosphate guanylyltransferase/mannose-6-phosphate isomerase [Escherichia coli]EGD